ncbi:MAG: DUF983 domain-containing protein [Gemmatimonadota bacterium]|nr:DUF983 domain-containing protein [Gemmatimonadota bacterium]
MTTPTVLPTPGRRIARALTLRCPECGASGLFRHWLQLRPRCMRCALRLDRGKPDHFVGAYLVNLILAELLFAGGLGVWLVAVWPAVPWDEIQYVAVAAMLLSPLVTYPFTRTMWLAADLIFDPPKASDR